MSLRKGDHMSLYMIFINVYVFSFVQGPSQAHPGGPPGPPVPAGRPEGHQAIGREDQ